MDISKKIKATNESGKPKGRSDNNEGPSGPRSRTNSVDNVVNGMEVLEIIEVPETSDSLHSSDAQSIEEAKQLSSSSNQPHTTIASQSHTRYRSGTSRSAKKRKRKARAISDEAMSLVRNDSHRNSITGTKMAIVHSLHPEKQLDSSFQDPLQNFMFKLLEETEDPLPHIVVDKIMNGALRVKCEGPAAVEWLLSINGKHINGAEVSVIDAKEIPKPVKMAWRCKTVSAELMRCLKMLQRCNPSLRTVEWKIVHVDVQAAITRTILLMDTFSAEVIKKSGYKLYSDLGESHFKLLNGHQKISKRVETLAQNDSAEYCDVAEDTAPATPGD